MREWIYGSQGRETETIVVILSLHNIQKIPLHYNIFESGLQSNTSYHDDMFSSIQSMSTKPYRCSSKDEVLLVRCHLSTASDPDPL